MLQTILHGKESMKKTVHVAGSDNQAVITFPAYYRNFNTARYIKLNSDMTTIESNGSEILITRNAVVTQDVADAIAVSHKENARNEFLRCIQCVMETIICDEDVIDILDKVIEAAI